MSDSITLANGKGTADHQTTVANPSGQAGEGDDAITAFDPSLLDTVVEKYQQPTNKATEKDGNPDRQKQIDKWKERIDNEEIDTEGNIYDLDHPKVPTWVKKEIETMYEPKAKAQQFDQLEWKLLVRDIPQLPKSVQKNLQQNFDEYMSLGKDVDPVRALKKAIQIAEKTDEAYQKGINRSRRASISGSDPVMTTRGSGLTESAERLGTQLGLTQDVRKANQTNHFTI